MFKKVLIHSNAHWVGTGYGQQCNLLRRILTDLGYQARESSFYGLNGDAIEHDGTVVYPGGTDAYGNDVLPAHANNFFGDEPGLILTLVDVWVLNPLPRNHVAAWTPVDHDPVPPAVAKFFHDGGGHAIAMSRFGQSALEQAGIPALYVPHAVDTTVMNPRERSDSRAVVGVPQDAFVVGMVAANKGFPARKSFGEAIEAFAAFHRSHDDAFLYLHTEATGVMHGVNLHGILAANQIDPARVLFSDPYWTLIMPSPADYMAQMFSAFDVLLSPSMGEGFGIPILEAQACGTPVIVNNFTAMPELCGAGWLTDYQRSYTLQHSFMATPIVESIEDRLEQAYRKAHLLKQQAVDFAQQYELEHVRDTYWKPVLEELGGRMAPLKVSKRKKAA